MKPMGLFYDNEGIQAANEHGQDDGYEEPTHKSQNKI